jgi:hypothetical protein
MALQSYTVAYSTNGSTWTGLTNVQNITIKIGKSAQLDAVNASIASFEMRYPTGYASPITQLVAGSYIRISNTTGTANPIWYGEITDVNATYGIPFSGGVGPADFLSVSCEGAFATVGRMQGNGYSMAASSIVDQFQNANIQTGLNFGYLPLSSSTRLAATTVNSTWGDWVNRVCQSTNSRLWDGIAFNGSTVISPFFNSVSTVNFSDVANDATNQVYNQINFDSLADNFYTQVTVTPESAGAATVTQVGASAPFRTYQTNTLNETTAQATDYGNYLLSNYGTARFAISSVTCSGDAQASFQLDKMGVNGEFGKTVGRQVSVAFRGTTYQCIVEGVTMSASPASSSFTFHLSGADLNAYFILNNAVFGRLDFNKLGY